MIIKKWDIIKEWFRLILASLRFKDVYSDDQSRFRLVTGFKLSLLPLISILILAILLWIILSINLYFFEAHGYGGIIKLRETYFDYILAGVVDVAWFFGLFFIFSTFVGVYISELLLRPFKQISEHCTNEIDGKKSEYDADFFSDLKLLTSFSEYFFSMIEVAKAQGTFQNLPVPKKFTKIHRPIFERNFIFHYILIMMIVSVISTVGIYIIFSGVYENMVQLSIDTLKQGPVLSYFFKEQAGMFDILLGGIIVIQITLYMILALHFYDKVAGPAFGIFATLRSFLKGKHNSRIHLIGYYYVRPYSRVINKYLDHIQRNLIEKAK